MPISSPRVSVVMPVHNGTGFLRAAIDSVLTQSYQDFEFIIIDDASQDETPAMLAACQDARIQVVTNDHNLGISRSLNRALDLAAGQYIARMDADDISLPDRLATQVAFLDAHPAVGIVGGGVILITETGEPLRTDTPRATTDGALRWLNLFGSPFVHPAVMLRRDVLRSINGYDPNVSAAQDRDLWDRLLGVTHGANLPEPLLWLRKHGANVSRTKIAEQQRNAATVAQRAMNRILEQPVDLSVCHTLEHYIVPDPASAQAAVEVVSQLYQAFPTKYTVSTQEWQHIRDDFARRLFRLAFRWPTNPPLLVALVRSALISPSATLSRMARPFRSVSDRLTP